MALLRIVNAFYAALFLVMAMVSVAFMGASIQDRDPLNLWVSIGWALLLLVYAVLAFFNMRAAAADLPGNRLIALNVAAAVPMLAGTLEAGPAGRFLCGVAAIPFALSALMLLLRRRGNPA